MGFRGDGGLADLPTTREIRVDGSTALLTLGIPDEAVRSLLASPETLLALLGGPADEAASEQDPPPPGQGAEPVPGQQQEEAAPGAASPDSGAP